MSNANLGNIVLRSNEFSCPSCVNKIGQNSTACPVWTAPR